MKKNTREGFKLQMLNVVGAEYRLISDYINSREKIKVKHIICGHEYEVVASSFLKGSLCPKCRQQKKANEFKEKFYNVQDNTYLLLSEYENSKTKVKVKHISCGMEYYVYPLFFLKGSRCPKCAKTKIPKSIEQFKEEVYNLTKDEYEVIGEYVGSLKKIRMKHNLCGNEFDIIANNFLRGNRCAICSKKNKKTTDEYKKEVVNLVNNEYEVIGEYINSNKKIRLIHNICGSIYEVRADSFLRGTRCPKCSKSKKK